MRRELGDAPAAVAGQEPAGVGESADMLSLLQRAIAAHEKAASQLVEQLKVKDDQIAALNERLQESNLLMGSLQKQLPAPAANRGRESKAVETVAVDATPTAERTMPSKKLKRRSWIKAILS